jgi:hypothetical protein
VLAEVTATVTAAPKSPGVAGGHVNPAVTESTAAKPKGGTGACCGSKQKAVEPSMVRMREATMIPTEMADREADAKKVNDAATAKANQETDTHNQFAAAVALPTGQAGQTLPAGWEMGMTPDGVEPLFINAGPRCTQPYWRMHISLGLGLRWAVTNEKFFHMPHQQPASMPVPALPAGWSKTLSNSTGATYYVKRVRYLSPIRRHYAVLILVAV